MANYTPDAPLLQGNEWVLIKDQLYPLDASQEAGTSFHLSAQITAQSARFYVAEDQLPTPDGTQIDQSAIYIYPRGVEDATGPLRQVIVPCNGGAVNGDFSISSTASNVSDALANVGDLKYCEFSGSFGSVEMDFAFASFPELDGKRIINIEWLNYIDGSDIFLTPDNSVTLDLFQKFISEAYLAGPGFQVSELGAIKAGINSKNGLNATLFESLDGIWGTTANYPTGTSADVYPWVYSRLQRYDGNYLGANGSRFVLYVANGIPDSGGSYLRLEYSALRVTYCEEQRVAVGGSRGWNDNGAGGYQKNSTNNANSISLRTMSLDSPNPVLPAGDYTMTVTGRRAGARLYATRELYPMRDQPGVVINYPTKVGQQFEAETTPQMVQLSLHDEAGSVAAVHGYGRQIQAPVWGASANPARQGVINATGGSTINYAWGRFYARRSENTVQDLTLHSVANTLVTASITVSDFDDLDEIADGWKEVTLRFSSPTPSFGNSAAASTYEWVSNETNPGNQWQVLGASAVVYDPDTPSTPISGTDDLGITTYGGITGFATYDGVADDNSDLTILFAQEMPAVSGLAVQVSSLSVTGIGTTCELIYADCVPTGISYHSLTWTPLSASTMPASGFGYYELQRSDAETDWQTILHATSPLVSGFADYEARVGIASNYRIRFQHRLLFPSNWSSTVSSTISAPGVTGTDVANGVLIFTTNNVQDGSRSLAYSMQWETDVQENFSFIEAASVKLQQMYGRDFQVAFRPLERGGERFQRTLLVQAAAVPDGLIQHGFSSLRDLAWEDVPYICVRDELGDRWLATVIVPDGKVQRNRRLYLATIDVIEVTDTASIVALPADGDCTPALWDGLPGWDYGCWS